ncbi:multicopper oxidase family protein [Skermania sp. ID1734]|uniref:multicopper oxidase family protein n=1 Tax=Skermania sp. ID1734 TaxID=2597516 RepID=UPI001180830C|nr:multicopper oxidase family protein [Skermania sp. ID1734]TSD93801.1 multicopper oxidase family protein [Skermania sp. ID1734]
MAPKGFPRPVTRRQFLALGAGATTAALIAGCSNTKSPSRTPVAPDSEIVRAAEDRRRVAGAARHVVSLQPRPTTVDLGGVQVQTWTFDGRVPGAEIRLRRGDVLQADLSNGLPQPSTIHWHGIALRNDMDGVPGLTQAAVAPQSNFRYEFTVPDSGTYWFHPHFGTQLDRGLYAPLIVEDPSDGRDYDVEAVLVLDDWLDGIAGRNPDRELDELRARGMKGMNMGGMSMSGMSMPPQRVDPHAPLGSDTGDVSYPYYLMNGRLGTDPVTLTARPRQRMRLRIINAASDTAFRVAVGGHQLSVTHTDGYPVQPAMAGCLLIGMGERYDALIDLSDGVFPLVAVAEGKNAQAFALIRTGAGDAPPANTRPVELNAIPLTAERLSAVEAVQLSRRTPDRVHDVVLGADANRYVWTINGKVYDEHLPLDVSQGERVRLRFVNKTMMFHPMHLHGHTFEVVNSAGTGPRKDTSIVLANQTVEVDFDADNPGQWLVHCHNLYHGEAGMMSVVSYVQ